MIIIIPEPISQRDYKTWENREKLFSTQFFTTSFLFSFSFSKNALFKQNAHNTLATKFYWPLFIAALKPDHELYFSVYKDVRDENVNKKIRKPTSTHVLQDQHHLRDEHIT